LSNYISHATAKPQKFNKTPNMTSNKAAWLREANAPLEVGEAPMPTAGPSEIIIQNAAVAINPLDTHMMAGVFIKEWPGIFGCDVAGVVHEVGSEVRGRFKPGDRVIG
jgi:NADPH:quinone reductase-like Zn-dependent oxidoreductase